METRSNPVSAPSVNGQAALIELMATLSETQKDVANKNLELTRKSGALDVTIVNNMAEQIGLSYDAQATAIEGEAKSAFAAGATSLVASVGQFRATFHTGGEDRIMSDNLKSLKNEISVSAPAAGNRGQGVDLPDNFKNSLLRSNGLDVEGKVLDVNEHYEVDNNGLRRSTNNGQAKSIREILDGSDEGTKAAFNKSLEYKIEEFDKRADALIERWKKGADTTQTMGQSTSQGVSATIRSESTLAQSNADQTRAKLDNAKSLTEQVQQSNQAASKDATDKMNAAFDLSRLADGINSLRG